MYYRPRPKSKHTGAWLDNEGLSLYRPFSRGPSIRRQMAPDDPQCLRNTAGNKA
jgi:hypothetical protein